MLLLIYHGMLINNKPLGLFFLLKRRNYFVNSSRRDFCRRNSQKDVAKTLFILNNRNFNNKYELIIIKKLQYFVCY